MKPLPYDPGPLPSRPAPQPGESISIEVQGRPPWKDVHFSIRNLRHRDHETFRALRSAAIIAMAGRAWYMGPVRLDLEVRCPAHARCRPLVDFLGGIGDTLDGGHGFTFTYLPIVFEDDCQIEEGSSRFVDAEGTSYTVTVTFLEFHAEDMPRS